jgi:2-aminoadipate transaminase
MRIQLSVSGGNSAALAMLCCHLCDAGSTVIVEGPTYFLAGSMLKQSKVKTHSVPVDEHGLVTSVLEGLLLGGMRPSAVYTIPTFQNPTGTVMSLERREHLIRLANEYNFYIFSDEPYSLLNYNPSLTLPPPLWHIDGGREKVISMGSFSKILAPGLRLGWLNASEAITKGLNQYGVLSSGGMVNPMSQRIVHSLVTSGDLSLYISKLRGVYTQRMVAIEDAIKEYLPSCQTFVPSQGGYFMWVKLPVGVSALALFEAAKKHCVGFTAGTRCSAVNLAEESHNPEDEKFYLNLDNYIRLSWAFYESHELKEGIYRISLALKDISA